jgi:mannose-6-phosphate isomerase
MTLPNILRLVPEYRDYVWGGDRLRPGQTPTAEAWVVYEKDRVAGGPLAGQSLAEVARAYGPALLGERAVRRTGTRFPLLVKLLDCANWLSLQVHPNDEQAARLEGPGQFGKTEAWHVLEAAEGSQLIAGVRPGTPIEALRRAIREGGLLELVQYLDVRGGDTLFMQPGTIHALGPGLLIYEVQQTSDLTYRVYDWGRPETPERPLHIDKSLAVVDPDSFTRPRPLPPLMDGEPARLVSCPYFTLEMLQASVKPFELDTRAETFHALTVIRGAARFSAGGETLELRRFETALVPAGTGEYRLEPKGPFQALRAGVGEDG